MLHPSSCPQLSSFHRHNNLSLVQRHIWLCSVRFTDPFAFCPTSQHLSSLFTSRISHTSCAFSPHSLSFALLPNFTAPCISRCSCSPFFSAYPQHHRHRHPLNCPLHSSSPCVEPASKRPAAPHFLWGGSLQCRLFKQQPTPQVPCLRGPKKARS